jgi:hypothetical protein
MEKRPKDLLEQDVYREWKLGNRGKLNDWKQPIIKGDDENY